MLEVLDGTLVPFSRGARAGMTIEAALRAGVAALVEETPSSAS